MDERMMLLRKIQALHFAMGELGLFLDTHPTDRQAIDLFTQYRTYLIPLEDEYNKKYGPLTMRDFAGGSYWTWISDPWPWENVAEEMK